MQAADTIQQLVEQYAPAIRQLGEEELSHKPAPDKWSKKEILGHLVDSAQTNIQRFVRGQYMDTPHIIYHQDEHVALQHYQAYDGQELMELWVSLNRHLCHVLHNMPAAALEHMCNTTKDVEEIHTLQWIAGDYPVHMQHHLRQIIPG